MFAVLSLSIATPSSAQPSNTPLPTVSFGGVVRDIERVGNTLFVAGDFLGASPSRNVGGGFAIVDNVAGGEAPGIGYVFGHVFATVPDGAGGYYIAGNFRHVTASTRTRLARIRADGTVDPLFAPIVLYQDNSGHVQAMVKSGNTLYIGGFFNTVNGQPRDSLAAVNATTGALLPWNPGARDGSNLATINTMKLAADDVLYIGGSFTSFAGLGLTRNRIAAFTAATGAPLNWNPSADAAVADIAVSATTVYAAGAFGTIGGQSRSNVAAIDRSTGNATAWNPSADFPALAIALVNNDVVFGGNFTTVGGQPRSYLAAVDAASGSLLPWTPAVSEPVASLAVSGSTVYAGGSFTSVSGSTRAGAAAFAWPGRTLTGWNPSMNGRVRSIALDGQRVLLGGEFSGYNATVRHGIAAIDVTTGALLPWDANLRGSVDTLASDGSTRLFAGGAELSNFLGAGTVRPYLRAFNVATAAELAWNPAPNGAVRELAYDGASGLFIAGDFTTVGNQARVGLAAVDAASGAALPFVANVTGGIVEALAISGSTVFAGGTFAAINGIPRAGLAALGAATGGVTSFSQPVTGNVLSMDVEGTTLFLGGTFSGIGPNPRQRLAAIDTTSGAVLPWIPIVNGAVRAIDATPALIVVGGDFTAIDGQNRSRIAGVALSGVLSAWNPTASSFVEAVSVGDDRVAIGGWFEYIGDRPLTGAAIFPTTANGAAPDGLDGSAIGNDVYLFWSAPSEGPAPTGYIIEAGSAPGLSNLATLPTGSTAREFLTTAPNGTYYVRVRAVTSAGTSGPSNEIVLNVGGSCAPPPAPTGMTGIASGSQVTLAWNASAGATGYIVQAGSASGLSNLATIAVAGNGLSTPAPNGTYFVRVLAQNACGTSASSNEVIVTVGVPATPPGTASNLAFTVNGSTVSLTWTAPGSGGATGYVLEAGSASGLANLVVFPLGPTPAFATMGVAPGTYYVRVRATNSAGTGPASNEVVVTVAGPTPPGPPSNLAFTVNGDTVSLTWTAPGSGGPKTGYVLEAGNAPGSPNLVVLPLGPTPAFATTDVPPGTYYVRVRATNGAGASVPSNEVVVSVP